MHTLKVLNLPPPTLQFCPDQTSMHTLKVLNLPPPPCNSAPTSINFLKKIDFSLRQGVHLQPSPINYAKFFSEPGVHLYLLHPLATPMSSHEIKC